MRNKYDALFAGLWFAFECLVFIAFMLMLMAGLYVGLSPLETK